MSNFGSKLADLLERNNIRAADLARTTGLSDALISKWVNGQQRYVDADDLAAICSSITHSARERAELIRAHLLDELGAPGSELIAVNIRGEPVVLRDAPCASSALPLRLQRALEILGRESITDADVRAVVLGLADLVTNSTTTPVSAHAAGIVGAAVVSAKQPLHPTQPVKYKVPRRSKSAMPPKPSAT